MGRRVGVLCVLVIALLGVTGVEPAAAALSITVTPRTINGGDHVQVGLTGVASGLPIGVFTCETEDLAGSVSPTLTFLFDHCAFSVQVVPTPQDGVSTFDYVPAEVWTNVVDGTGSVRHRCGRAPDDCSIVVFSPSDNASSPPVTITMAPRPLLIVPSTLTDGDPITVLVSGPQPQVDAAQCALPVQPALAASTCGEPVTIPLTDGFGDGVLIGAGAIGGQNCVADGAFHCAVATFDPTGALVASFDVSVGFPPPPPPLEVQVSPNQDVQDGETLTAFLLGGGEIPLWVGQCAASVVDTGDVDTGPCTEVQAATGTTSGQNEVTAPAHLRFTGADGTEVDCGTAFDACVYAVESQAADDTSFDTAPIAFDRPDVITFAPTEGLLDGDTVAIDATGLVPNLGYLALLCEGVDDAPVLYFEALPCDPDVFSAVETGPDGALHLEIQAHQRFTDDLGVHHTCREGCEAVLGNFTGANSVAVAEVAPLTMAEGRITVAPDTGLVDGQAVTVTGSELMPSYEGPVLFLPTGSWGLGQCDAAVADDPTLLDVFTLCGPVDQSAPLQVTGPDLSVTVGVQTTVDHFLGGTTDCTTGPHACVLALARWEQDGTVTVHTAPVSFG